MPRLPPLEPSPYKTYVEAKSYYIHPRTGMRASREAVRRLKLKPVTFIYLRRSEDKGIVSRVKVTKQESLLTTFPMKDRWASHALGRFKVYDKIWKNFAGHVRIILSGQVQEGRGWRRIKEVFYLAYHRRHWEMQARGYRGFKDFLLGSVLSHLRRRGLRLSNPRESQERIAKLEKDRRRELGLLDQIPREFSQMRRGKEEKIKWAGEAIRQQKESRQLRAATIRVEKLGG